MIFAAGTFGQSGAVLTLDDPTVDTDRGSTFTARMISAPFDAGPSGGWQTLRRLAQQVILGRTATVTVTPIVDGQEHTGQANTSSMTIIGFPSEQVVEVPTFSGGTRFQQKVEVTAHVGPIELGESDQWFVKRRDVRNRS